MHDMAENESAARAALIVAAIKRAGIDLVTTLPDSWLGDVIDALAADPAIKLVRVAREEDGVGICAGAWLGGRKSVLLAQNGGMLQSVNALAALAMFHQIPVLMMLVQRGSHDDSHYYQVYKGRATVPVLDALRLPHHKVEGPDDFHLIEEAAREAHLSRGPVALLFSRRAVMGNAPPKG